MIKSIEETVEERRNYVNQIKESFRQSPQENSGNEIYGRRDYDESGNVVTEVTSSFGFRALIAVLLFAAFVYCDRENITFQNYGTKDIVSQMEWELLPVDELQDVIKITK